MQSNNVSVFKARINWSSPKRKCKKNHCCHSYFGWCAFPSTNKTIWGIASAPAPRSPICNSK
uniref:Uncharacterized protein n=1 Tax=Arundo donax TaxID=35708 RepID=A0A0A9GUX7_ARUDO